MSTIDPSWFADIIGKVDNEKDKLHYSAQWHSEELLKYQEIKKLTEDMKKFHMLTPNPGGHIDKHDDLLSAATYKYMWETTPYDPSKLDIKVHGDKHTGTMTAEFPLPYHVQLQLTLVEQVYWVKQLNGYERWEHILKLMKTIENAVAHNTVWNDDQLEAYLMLVAMWKASPFHI
jgi:hypothetical protein